MRIMYKKGFIGYVKRVYAFDSIICVNLRATYDDL